MKIMKNKKNSMYYEKLREHYYTLFPEEKKLEFGCEVIWTGGKGLHKDKRLIVIKPRNVAWGLIGNDVASACESDGTVYEEITGYEILGQPLTLAMILRALKLYAIDNHGQLCPAMAGTDVGIHYKPKLDGIKLPLHLEVKDWDEETLKTIYELVCTTKN